MKKIRLAIIGCMAIIGNWHYLVDVGRQEAVLMLRIFGRARVLRMAIVQYSSLFTMVEMRKIGWYQPPVM